MKVARALRWRRSRNRLKSLKWEGLKLRLLVQESFLFNFTLALSGVAAQFCTADEAQASYATRASSALAEKRSLRSARRIRRHPPDCI